MLYRFSIELSDIDRDIYQTLEFRIAQHPSETLTYLLARVLAYVLSFEPELEFAGAGLSDPEVPALKSTLPNGTIDLWIEIGNPSTKKLHKANKSARRVVVYTYKNAEVLVKDIENNDVHRAQDLQIYGIDSKFLNQLEKHLQKNNHWSILHQQGQLDVNRGEESLKTEIQRFYIKK